MHVVQHHRFGEVEAFELGYGPYWRPFLTVYVYCVAGVAIDSGPRRMQRSAREIYARWRPELLLLTHYHEDHSGNAALVQRELGTEVLAPAQALDKLRRGFPVMPYQHLAWGLIEPFAAEPLPARIEAGRCSFTPLHTPGHSKDHTVYLERERGWLFSGDLYISDRIKRFRSDEHIGQQISSLRRVLSNDFDALFCAHRPHRRRGRRRLQAKLAFLEDFCGEIAGYAARGDGERAILQRLQERENSMWRLATGGNVSFAHMVRSALRQVSSPAPRAPCRAGPPR
jgi:glyoxylase-like metal-dependent hydrolase (beta-lactamase superfamily II)